MDILENAKCMNQEISKVQLYFKTPILTNSVELIILNGDLIAPF